ncbi:MAG: DUF4405 domain-containing protein [Pseudomonadota bacterium]
MPTKHANPAPHPRHVNLRLERWHRRCIYGSCAALFVSGVAWLVAHFFLRSAGQFGEAASPIEPWAMKLHGAAVMVALFFLGSLVNSHIRRALKTGRNRSSGLAMMATLLVLVFSGYGLYYLASEGDRPVWSAVHWIVGLALGALILVHVLLGRRSNPYSKHS